MDPIWLLLTHRSPALPSIPPENIWKPLGDKYGETMPVSSQYSRWECLEVDGIPGSTESKDLHIKSILNYLKNWK